MKQSMYAALLFAMLSGMEPETTAPNDTKPQSNHASSETEQTKEPVKT